MSIEIMTVSEIAEVLGLSRQAINNRVKELPEEDIAKTTRVLLLLLAVDWSNLKEICKRLSLKDEPVSDEVKKAANS